MIIQKAGERLNIEIYNKILTSIQDKGAYNQSARFSLVKQTVDRDFTICLTKEPNFDSGLLQVFIEVEKNGNLITTPVSTTVTNSVATVEDKHGNSASSSRSTGTLTQTFYDTKDGATDTYIVKIGYHAYELNGTGVIAEHLLLKYDNTGNTIQNMYFFTKKTPIVTGMKFQIYNANVQTIRELVTYMGLYLNGARDNRGFIRHTDPKDLDLSAHGVLFDFSSIKSTENVFEYKHVYFETDTNGSRLRIEDSSNIVKVEINGKFYVKKERIFLLTATGTAITKTYTNTTVALSSYDSYVDGGDTYYMYEFLIGKELTYTEIPESTPLSSLYPLGVPVNSNFRVYLGYQFDTVTYATIGHFMGTPVTDMLIGSELLNYVTLDDNIPITQKMINDINTLFTREFYRDINTSVTATGGASGTGGYLKYKNIPFLLRLTPNDSSVDAMIDISHFGISWKIDVKLQEGIVTI